LTCGGVHEEELLFWTSATITFNTVIVFPKNATKTALTTPGSGRIWRVYLRVADADRTNPVTTVTMVVVVGDNGLVYARARTTRPREGIKIYI